MLRAPWDKLHIDKDLACEFLGIFSRYEYSLKVAGFIKGSQNHAEPDWREFSKAISTMFDENATPKLAGAVNYLFDKPPLKYVKAGNSWANVTFKNDETLTEKLLIYVRTIRNNLFHGGKYLPQPDGEPNRDRRLVEAALVILSYCITLNQKVEDVFYN